MKENLLLTFCLPLFLFGACSPESGPPKKTSDPDEDRVTYEVEEFAMGVDLSYVNQVQDHGGVYRDSTV